MGLKTPYTVVPINIRTGRPYKTKPTYRRPVLYALRGPRGSLKILNPDPQDFYPNDLKGLNDQVANTKGGDFILFEQKTRQKKIVKVRQRSQGKTRYVQRTVPITKIMGIKPSTKQRAILFKKGKRFREVEHSFYRQRGRDISKKKQVIYIRPNQQKAVEVLLEGKTIKEAISHLAADINFHNFTKESEDKAFTYNIQVRITDPKGNVERIPLSGSDIPEPFERNIKKPEGWYVGQFLQRISNLQVKMSTAIRYAIKAVGYRYTSLTELDKLTKDKRKDIARLKKSKDPNKTDKIEKIENTIDKMWYMGRSYDNVRKLKQLTSEYKVQILVRFELY